MFILRRGNNPDRQGEKSTIGDKRSLVLCTKSAGGVDGAGVFLLSSSCF